MEVDANANFLEDREPDDYPSVLRITSDAEMTLRQQALALIDRWNGEEAFLHVSELLVDIVVLHDGLTGTFVYRLSRIISFHQTYCGQRRSSMGSAFGFYLATLIAPSVPRRI